MTTKSGLKNPPVPVIKRIIKRDKLKRIVPLRIEFLISFCGECFKSIRKAIIAIRTTMERILKVVSRSAIMSRIMAERAAVKKINDM